MASRQSVRSNVGETTQSYGSITPWAPTDTLWATSRSGRYHRAKHIIEGQCSVSKPNVSGETSLHIACQENQPYIVELLLRQKVNWAHKTRAGETAMDVAVRMNRPQCVAKMLPRIQVSSQQMEKYYRHAHRNRMYDMLEVLRRHMTKLKSIGEVKMKAMLEEEDQKENEVEFFTMGNTEEMLEKPRNAFGEEVAYTDDEKANKPVRVGAYDNLRSIRHQREREHLRKPVVEWTNNELGFWIMEQSALGNERKEYREVIIRGNVSGEGVASLQKEGLRDLLSRLGFHVGHRRHVLNNLIPRMKKDKSYARRDELKENGSIRVMVSSEQQPMYNVIGIVELRLEHSLVDARREIKAQGIAREADLGPFEFINSKERCRIKTEMEPYHLVEDFSTILVITETSAEDEQRWKDEQLRERKEQLKKHKGKNFIHWSKAKRRTKGGASGGHSADTMDEAEPTKPAFPKLDTPDAYGENVVVGGPAIT